MALKPCSNCSAGNFFHQPGGLTGIPRCKSKTGRGLSGAGLMLDTSRHFYNPAEIETILDPMAMQKMNPFHWHLTDDQGWRIEIKKYPRL